MRPIGEILRDAATGAEFAAPVSVFGSNDRFARRLVTALRMSCMDLQLLIDGQGWSQQQSTWVFRLEAGKPSYPLPPDYLALIQDTDRISGNLTRLCGPVEAATLADWRAGRNIPVSRYGAHVRMGRLYVEPVPTEAVTVSIHYLSRWPALQAATGWDSALWDGVPGDHAKAPFVTREGWLAVRPADLGMTADEFNAAFRLQTPPVGWDSSNDTDGDGWPDAYVRKAFFTADTDLSAIDGDLLLADVLWRVRRATGLPYAEEAALAERLKSTLRAHDHGGAATFSIDHNIAGDGYEPPLPSTEPRLW